ncbi:Zinc finger family protein / BRCT domain-containing protein, putative isoform 2 [Hibiscus syriacus]|uniref:RING-type E3 ubiquitin transferase BRCA1 n=1 Tax=Hibiscus syriacus TaxID=106335 RepID=A0A6A3D1K6_HIBSY|nr:uncharacterized protein LOC120122892 [Hibiscus syriacus]KAE8733648.1 Zinc finger family protein / BRCT domain-containing protein, putative isoform 2 [Hibiscus syriacus]
MQSCFTAQIMSGPYRPFPSIFLAKNSKKLHFPGYRHRFRYKKKKYHLKIEKKKMEPVVVSVSGYRGLERFNLIKLISLAGASYVGNFSRSVTHLVCRRFEGKKYELAKKLKLMVVNHRWIEDCIKEGKRLPEEPYMLRSGEEMGPLLLEIPEVAKGDALTKKCKVFSEKPSVHDSVVNEITDVDYGGSGLSGWSKSAVLDEHGDPFSYASVPPMRNKRKISKNKEPNAHRSALLLREERDLRNGSRDTSMIKSSQRKGRRLVKKINREIVVSDSSDSDQECYPVPLLRVHKPCAGVINPSNRAIGGPSNWSTVGISEIGEPSNREFSKLQRVDEEIEVEEIKLWNIRPPSNGLTSPGKNAQPAAERASPDGCSDAGGETQYLASRLSTSMDLSCVICWTEFSPTRGILQCGHRFCYSCIQEWADKMTSNRKTPFCPLCKARFTSITKVEDAAISDQKIFSQTIPCTTPTLHVPILSDQERAGFGAQLSAASVCIMCRCREPEDLLISCHVCQMRNIHRYCLDPPLLPWTCIHCQDLERLNPYTF